MTESDIRVWMTFDALSNAVAGFSLMTTLALQQVRLRLRHWMVYLCPYLPMLICAMTVADIWPVTFRVINIITYLYTIALQLYCIYSLRRYDRQLLDLYTDIEHKETRWYRSLLAARLLVILLWAPLDFWPDMEWIWYIYNLTLIVVHVRATAYAVSHEQFVMEKEAQAEAEERQTEMPSPAHEIIEVKAPTERQVAQERDDRAEAIPQWFVKMEQLMQTEHVYRQADLTSSSLAKMVQTNRTYISRYLNEKRGQTFFDYVCAYRIKESEELLLSGDEQMNINQIADAVGFKDRNAFYRMFRMKHECSPTEWGKREREKRPL